jgi:hypothetical protein
LYIELSKYGVARQAKFAVKTFFVSSAYVEKVAKVVR